MSAKILTGELVWKEKIFFEVLNESAKSFTDATVEHGGEHLAPTPKELVLNGMMGCTAMDVLALLKKMRFEFVNFKMTASAEMTEAHPIHFKSVHLNYHLISKETDQSKLIKAVDLSMTKYCGVNFMISRVCPVTYDIHLNDQKLHSGQAF